MSNITFEELCQICNNFRVTHTMSGLRAVYDTALEKLLGEFATNIIFVGHDNNKESFNIDKHTFVSITRDGGVIHGMRPDGTEEEFYFTEWNSVSTGV